MNFHCKKHLHKCKAACCGVVPMSKEVWERNQHKVVTKPVKIVPGVDDIVIPETEALQCAFINTDLSCNIYEDRPSVCREFGTEIHVMMKCHIQDKEGRERSRQNQRKVLRDQEKSMKNMLNRFKIFDSVN